jgi:hypothetical protein
MAYGQRLALVRWACWVLCCLRTPYVSGWNTSDGREKAWRMVLIYEVIQVDVDSACDL